MNRKARREYEKKNKTTNTVLRAPIRVPDLLNNQNIAERIIEDKIEEAGNRGLNMALTGVFVALMKQGWNCSKIEDLLVKTSDFLEIIATQRGTLEEYLNVLREIGVTTENINAERIYRDSEKALEFLKDYEELRNMSRVIEREQIEKLHAQGLDKKQVVEELGITTAEYNKAMRKQADTTLKEKTYKLLEEGKTNKEIAEELECGTDTVRMYRNRKKNDDAVEALAEQLFGKEEELKCEDKEVKCEDKELKNKSESEIELNTSNKTVEEHKENSATTYKGLKKIVKVVRLEGKFATYVPTDGGEIKIEHKKIPDQATKESLADLVEELKNVMECGEIWNV